MNNTNSYRDNLKTTILFSFVQVYQIFIRIVRSKFVALFIGPDGMGIMSLLHSTTDLVSATTNLGLKTSGVKSVAEADSANDSQKVELIVTVLRRLILITGLAGMIICIVLSPFFSKTSFGNNQYIWSFIFVSVIILLEQLNNGEQVVLQGLQKKKILAKASLIGSTIGVLVVVPLYYFYGKDAIVGVLVFSYLLTYLISKYFTSKLGLKTVDVSFKEVLTIGRDMIKLGILFSVQLVLSQLAMYVVRNYVSNVGSLDDVGLYSAGSTIINLYLGLVFTAMATDYFPRLAKTKSNDDLHQTINQQAEITLLLFAPIVVVFIVFIKPIILLLYSDRFLPIEMMLYYAMSGTLIKAMAWSMSYSIVAKAKPAIYFWNEFASIIYMMILNIGGYKLFGLTGFGLSIVIGYILYFIQLTFVTKRFFNYKMTKGLWNMLALLNILVLSTLAVKLFIAGTYGYVIGAAIIGATFFITYRLLDERMNLKEWILSKIKKNA